jgi:hypothetical protein
MLIRLKPMPLNENVEQSHCISQSALEVGPNTMGNLLEVANQGQHGQDRLDDHAAVPFSALAEFEVGWIPVLLGKPFITENDHLVSDKVNQFLKGRAIVDIGRGAGPIDDQTEVIYQEAQLPTNNPARVGLALLADLLSAASFTARVDQFNAIAVDDAEQGRLGHELFAEMSMGVEQSIEACPLGQLGEQVPKIPLQPAVKRSVTDTLEGEQQGQGYDFTGVQFGLCVLGNVQHPVIHTAEQFDDKIFSSHGVPPSLFGSQLTAWGNFVAMSN